MANRKLQEARAIEASRVHTEEPKKRAPRRERSMAALETSWGALDCDFYFRWAEAAIGFRAQAMEPQAITLGRRLVPFWDAGEAERMQLRYLLTPEMQLLLRTWEETNLLSARESPWEDYEADREKRRYALGPAMRALLESMELATGPAARPVHGRQARVVTQPDRTTDEHLDAVRRYRRIERGMGILREQERGSFAILHHTFLPRRNPPEIEGKFGQLSDLVIRCPRILSSHEMEMGREKEADRVTLETWLLRRIEKGDAIVSLALGDAQALALGAVRAFEAVTEPPREVREAEHGTAEPRHRASRPAKVVSLGYEGASEPGTKSVPGLGSDSLPAVPDAEGAA